ncbi:MAG: hypothetical protein OEV99_13885 [Nitrospira sp.]|nr:hypothetical protein [Nitrospira sp.]MDH4370915.1 hypothetical protein [Nitrospira sp.]MDH5347136.1 hypothetical protein [Nitrospira sp.]MDH5498526.1 hypothetical protein [Nitrospira sp.]MDH5725215.1 hypothetical protein [Nitrospira sp.]
MPRSATGREPQRETPTKLVSNKAQRDGQFFAIAYNEFCAPTLEESVESLIKQGATSITVTTTMFTPGGSH